MNLVLKKLNRRDAINNSSWYVKKNGSKKRKESNQMPKKSKGYEKEGDT